MVIVRYEGSRSVYEALGNSVAQTSLTRVRLQQPTAPMAFI